MEFKQPARSSRQKTSAHLTSGTPPPSTPIAPEDDASISRLLLTVLKDKTTLVIIAGVVGVIILGLVIFAIIHQRTTGTPTGTAQQQGLSKGKPTYDTVLPKNKSIDTLGGWTRISPPKNDPVYAYIDKIGETPISVSEQPLPDSFKGSADEQLGELAKKFNATTKLQAGSTAAYLGTSAKGPQSVIFIKGNLLILIKSQNKIDTKDWTSYIQSLN